MLTSAQWGEGGDRLGQRPAERGQRIIDADRNGGMDRAFYQSIAFEALQRLGQHLLGESADVASEMIEPHWTVLQPIEHQERPLVGQPVEHQAGGGSDRRRRHRRDSSGLSGRFPEGNLVTGNCLLSMVSGIDYVLHRNKVSDRYYGVSIWLARFWLLAPPATSGGRS